MKIYDKPITGDSFLIDDSYIQEGNWQARKITELKAALQKGYAICDLKGVCDLNATLIVRLFEAITTERVSLKCDLDEGCDVVYLDITHFAKDITPEALKGALKGAATVANRLVLKRTANKTFLACVYKKELPVPPAVPDVKPARAKLSFDDITKLARNPSKAPAHDHIAESFSGNEDALASFVIRFYFNCLRHSDDKNAQVFLIILKAIQDRVLCLNLASTDCTPTQIELLVMLFPNLQTLTLDSNTIDAPIIAALAKLPNLQSLSLICCQIKEEDIPLLVLCPKLKILNLKGVMTTGLNFDKLPKTLEMLTCELCYSLTEDALEKLAVLPALKTLNISGTRLKGLFLASLPMSLKYFSCLSCPIDQEALDKFTAARPSLTIY
jgi:hypothetical protein